MAARIRLAIGAADQGTIDLDKDLPGAGSRDLDATHLHLARLYQPGTALHTG
jgi:hypothetical protein